MPKDICNLGKETIATNCRKSVISFDEMGSANRSSNFSASLYIVMVNTLAGPKGFSVICYTQPCSLTELVVSAGCCSQFGSSESTSARYFSMASIFARSPSLFHASLHEDSPTV